MVINGDACLCYKAQHDSVVNYYAPASPDYWETNKFHQSLRSGQHFVWHIEHSFSTKLGDPTIFGPNPITPCGIMSPAQEVACQNGLAADQAPVEDLLASQVLGLDNAAGYPNYSIVMSSGSFTNTYEGLPGIVWVDSLLFS